MLGIGLSIGMNGGSVAAPPDLDSMILLITSHTDNTFRIDLQNAATNITVDWGDSTSDVITTYNQAELDHTYPDPSTQYTVTISGQFGGTRFITNDTSRVNEIQQWGTTAWTNASFAFQSASTLSITATDYPNVSAVTTFQEMFGYSGIPSIDTTNWDTSSGQSFNGMLSGCTSLVTANVTNLVQASATILTQLFDGSNNASLVITGINTWVPTNVYTCYRMFRNCKFVSLDFSALVFGVNVTWEEMCRGMTNLTTFTKPTVTPTITSLYFTFYNTGLSGTLDLTSLCSTSTTTIGYCLSNNASLTTVTTTGWVTSNVTNVSNFISSSGITTIGLADMNMEAVTLTTNFATGTTLSTATYDAALIAWDAQNLVDSLTWNFGGSKYTGGGAAEAARASLISTDSLTILDGGVAP